MYFFLKTIILTNNGRCPILFCIEQLFFPSDSTISTWKFPILCPVYFLIIFLMPYLISLLQQTVWLFFRDMIKGILLSILLGPPIVSAIIIIVQVNLFNLVVLVYTVCIIIQKHIIVNVIFPGFLFPLQFTLSTTLFCISILCIFSFVICKN